MSGGKIIWIKVFWMEADLGWQKSYYVIILIGSSNRKTARQRALLDRDVEIIFFVLGQLEQV